MSHLSQFPPSMSAGSLLQAQRIAAGMTHVKDDGSNLSPSSSPHPSNPSSPLAVSTVGLGDHSVNRVFGEDRKLPRPIGTERAHKKAPSYNNSMADCDIFQWRVSGGGGFPSSSEPMPPPQEDRLPVMQQNYMQRFGDGLSNVMENSHHLDTSFAACRPTKSMMSTHPGSLNSAFMPFVNGMPQQVPTMSQLYATSAIGIDIWGSSSAAAAAVAAAAAGGGNNMKTNLGDNGGQQDNPNATHPLSASLISGQILGGGGAAASTAAAHRQPPSEHKMMWNSWNHMQM